MATESKTGHAGGHLTVSSPGSTTNGQFTDQELFAPVRGHTSRAKAGITTLSHRSHSRHGDDGPAAAHLRSGLIGLIAYGVWVHATTDTGHPGATRGTRRQGRAVRLLHSDRRGRNGDPLHDQAALRRTPEGGAALLARSGHGAFRLFQFVERLCRTIRGGSRRIDLDTQVNASASFQRRIS